MNTQPRTLTRAVPVQPAPAPAPQAGTVMIEITSFDDHGRETTRHVPVSDYLNDAK